MLKVCVIGIGNAGNQIAELAKKERNIPGIALNSSEKDISTLCHVDKFIVGDEKGAGKDRNIAKEFMRQNIQTLLKQDLFKKMVEENEVVFIVSSTGGGTGSGMAPVLTDILTRVYPMKKFLLTFILPPLRESVAAQQNTIEYLKEMRKFNPTYLPYDNNKLAGRPTSVMMEEVNKEVVEDFCIIRGDYQFATQYNSIDEKDMLKLIETPGRLSFAKVYNIREKDLDDKSIEDHLINNITNTSVMCELERDRIIKRLGIITNLNEKMHKLLDTNLPTLKELIGEPVEGFEHIYVNKADDEPNRVIAILSGLSVPDDRIEKVLQRIEDAEEQLMKTKDSSILDDAKTDLIDELRDTSGSKVGAQEVDLGDIFDSYMKK